MYIYIYIYTHTHTHTHTYISSFSVSYSVTSNSVRPHGLDCQAPLSMGFTRQEYCGRLPLLSAKQLVLKCQHMLHSKKILILLNSFPKS